MTNPFSPTTSERVIISWAMINIPFLALLAAGFITGYIQPYIFDVTYLTHTIIAILVLAILHLGAVACRIRRDFVDWRILRSDYHDNPDLVYQRIDSRLDTTRYISTLLIGLGFLGTVIGVIIGLQHFPENAFTDVVAMQGFIQRMLVGFSTELHTLVAGLVGSIWLNFNVHIMERYDTKLYLKLIQ